MSLPKTSIALIICSTRTPRVAPTIASWITTTLQNMPIPNITLTTIDLADWALPISPMGAIIPGRQPVSHADYGHELVNAWSAEVRRHAGFIFLTPQYNWSFPAAVKCALDHLYHEWATKPALIVSYGSRGGARANAQLREVLMGLRMNAWEGKVELPLKAGHGAHEADRGVLVPAVEESWQREGCGEQLLERWQEMTTILSEQ